MEKICGECAHYQHGVLEHPCAKNPRYVGYLKEGCRLWEKEKGEINEEELTKVCKKCGRELPLDMFYQTRLTKDKLTDVCKECEPHWRHRQKKENL